jgi:hypothetical protein
MNTLGILQKTQRLPNRVPTHAKTIAKFLFRRQTMPGRINPPVNFVGKSIGNTLRSRT